MFLRAKLQRYRRQAIDDDDDLEGDSSNVTESPLHDVKSDGGVQITINIVGG